MLGFMMRIMLLQCRSCERLIKVVLTSFLRNEWISCKCKCMKKKNVHLYQCYFWIRLPISPTNKIKSGSSSIPTLLIITVGHVPRNHGKALLWKVMSIWSDSKEHSDSAPLLYNICLKETEIQQLTPSHRHRTGTDCQQTLISYTSCQRAVEIREGWGEIGQRSEWRR